MDSAKMSTKKQVNNTETYLTAGNDFYLLSLKQYILPSIIRYYADNYSIDDVTVDKLATNALGVSLPTNRDIFTPTKENSRKPKVIDVIDGCQYIMEKSRTRPGEVCGAKRDLPGHFCKECQKKANFAIKIEPYLERLGLKLEDVVGPNYVPYVPKQAKKGKTAKPPARRGPKSNIPVSKPKYKSKAADYEDREEEEYDNIDADEVELQINGVVIEGLDDILYDNKSNIVFHMPPDNPQDIIAIGQWTEDGKISRLTEPLKITAVKCGMTVGKYEDYDLGKYNVNYVERKGRKNEEEKEEEEEEEKEEDEEEKEVKPVTRSKNVDSNLRLQPEERLRVIPNRRSIRQSKHS